MWVEPPFSLANNVGSKMRCLRVGSIMFAGGNTYRTIAHDLKLSKTTVTEIVRLAPASLS
jgi:DNA-binding transcriptional regulator LsrR (DeoR family)